MDGSKTDSSIFHFRMCEIPLKANWSKVSAVLWETFLPERVEINSLTSDPSPFLLLMGWGPRGLTEVLTKVKVLSWGEGRLTTKELGLSKTGKILQRPALSPLIMCKFLSPSRVPSLVSLSLCKAHYYYNSRVIREENAGSLSMAGGLLFPTSNWVQLCYVAGPLKTTSAGHDMLKRRVLNKEYRKSWLISHGKQLLLVSSYQNASLWFCRRLSTILMERNAIQGIHTIEGRWRVLLMQFHFNLKYIQISKQWLVLPQIVVCYKPIKMNHSSQRGSLLHVG